MTTSEKMAAMPRKPTIETRYHINFAWWARERQALHVYLQNHLCEEHRSELASEYREDDCEDWIDPETGEVHRLDRIRYAIVSHCSQQVGYLTSQIALVDAIFRVFLSNSNHPLTSEEIALRIGREGQAGAIRRTLSGKRIYNGLRPVTG